MSTLPALCVVIVSYRTPELTVRAARTALEAGVGQVVVVDNASGDATLNLLRSVDDARLEIVARVGNDGFGTAANAGARAAAGSVLAFLNSDAELSAAAADVLVAEVGRHDGLAVVGPRLVGSDGSIQHSTGLILGPASLAMRGIGLHRLARHLLRLPVIGQLVGRASLAQRYDIATRATQPMEVEVVTGACFAVGREAFLELGGFDQQFFLYFEDIDLCRRARAAGFAIRYLPDAVVPHIGGASSADDYHFGPAHARSMRQYLAKWYGPGGAVVAIAILWLRAMGLTLALRPRAGVAWRALAAALRPGGGPP